MPLKDGRSVFWVEAPSGVYISSSFTVCDTTDEDNADGGGKEILLADKEEEEDDDDGGEGDSTAGGGGVSTAGGGGIGSGFALPREKMDIRDDCVVVW